MHQSDQLDQYQCGSLLGRLDNVRPPSVMDPHEVQFIQYHISTLYQQIPQVDISSSVSGVKWGLCITNYTRLHCVLCVGVQNAQLWKKRKAVEAGR